MFFTKEFRPCIIAPHISALNSVGPRAGWSPAPRPDPRLPAQLLPQRPRQKHPEFQDARLPPPPPRPKAKEGKGEEEGREERERKPPRRHTHRHTHWSLFCKVNGRLTPSHISRPTPNSHPLRNASLGRALGFRSPGRARRL